MLISSIIGAALSPPPPPHTHTPLQEVHERDCQVQQLQCESEEAQKERDSQSITTVDISRGEIDTLKKVPFIVVNVYGILGIKLL